MPEILEKTQGKIQLFRPVCLTQGLQSPCDIHYFWSLFATLVLPPMEIEDLESDRPGETTEFRPTFFSKISGISVFFKQVKTVIQKFQITVFCFLQKTEMPEILEKTAGESQFFYRALAGSFFYRVLGEFMCVFTKILL